LNISLRKADLKDKELLFKWFNNLDSLKFKIKTNLKISFITHEKWFISKLIDKNTFIWIIEGNERKIGQIRFQYSKGYYDVDIYVIKDFRKLGIASLALKEAENISKLKPLRAFIKNNNKASHLFFLKNGFCMNYKNKDFISLVKE
jgi:GNAT superfamily N-acetyltransferase